MIADCINLIEELDAKEKKNDTKTQKKQVEKITKDYFLSCLGKNVKKQNDFKDANKKEVESESLGEGSSGYITYLKDSYNESNDQSKITWKKKILKKMGTDTPQEKKEIMCDIIELKTERKCIKEGMGYADDRCGSKNSPKKWHIKKMKQYLQKRNQEMDSEIMNAFNYLHVCASPRIKTMNRKITNKKQEDRMLEQSKTNEDMQEVVIKLKMIQEKHLPGLVHYNKEMNTLLAQIEGKKKHCFKNITVEVLSSSEKGDIQCEYFEIK